MEILSGISKAMAAGTTGHRRLTAREASLVEDQQILKK